MYGQIHVVVKELVESQFGQQIWNKILLQSGMDEDTDFLVFSVYDDSTTSRLIESVCRVLDYPREQLLKEFGTYFLTYCTKYGYDKMLLTLGEDLFTFVQNLDSLYSMLSLSYKGIISPSFRCQEHDDGTLTLDYYSWRQGYYPIVQGIVEAVGKHLYQQEATVSVVNCSEEEVSYGTFRYHTTMRVSVTQPSVGVGEGESKIITASQERQQRRRLNIDITKAVKQGGVATCLTQGDLCHAFPYHILMDRDLRVLQCGNAIRMICLPIDSETHFYNIADIRQPIIECTADNIISFINSVFIIEIISIQLQPIILKGQMMWLSNCCLILFMGSLRLRTLTDMKEQKLFLADIPLHDCTRELMLLNQQRIFEIAAARLLDETTTALKNTSKALAIEKQKTEQLLHEMMPRKVAEQLTRQGFVNAVKYKSATVLFSSTLTFADIVWSCSADQVVDMLNDMYFRFDNHTDMHRVYKVETIGDAYMAVTGVPEAQEDHVERMANFAMDMVEAASYVRSPATGYPLQIQVGFHSGSVVAGVIGHKKPRYDIYGDAVNTASRMCSHSVPSRIHVTSVSFQKLYKRGYVFKNRGEIEVKGKGKMTTYFLVGTLERDLKQPDDRFSFLPDMLDADAHIDPSIQKFIKKKVDVVGEGQKLMTVQQSRKSTVFYRHMKDVQQGSAHLSSSVHPSPLDASACVLVSSGSLNMPGHHKQTWDLSPPPLSAGFSFAPVAPAPAPVPVPVLRSRSSTIEMVRKMTVYPEHHHQTWDLSPPPSTSEEVRVLPPANRSNSSCNIDDSRPAYKNPNRSNSSCDVDDPKPTAKTPSKSNSSDSQTTQITTSSSSDQSDVLSDSSRCSGSRGLLVHGDFSLSPKTTARMDSFNQAKSVPGTGLTPERYSPTAQYRFLPPSTLPEIRNPRAAQASQFVWSDVRRNMLGQRPSKTFKQKRPSMVPRCRRIPSTSQDTTSLPDSTSRQLSMSSLSLRNFFRHHSITNLLRPREDRSQGCSSFRGFGDKDACLIS
ncbi:hypothetical protein ACOMHN_024343 [Nucella lapillus]